VSPAAPALPVLPSCSSGLSDVPLLGETIGDNFDLTVADTGKFRKVEMRETSVVILGLDAAAVRNA
jgi:hypothetical protein